MSWLAISYLGNCGLSNELRQVSVMCFTSMKSLGKWIHSPSGKESVWPLTPHPQPIWLGKVLMVTAFSSVRWAMMAGSEKAKRQRDAMLNCIFENGSSEKCVEEVRMSNIVKIWELWKKEIYLLGYFVAVYTFWNRRPHKLPVFTLRKCITVIQPRNREPDISCMLR